MVIIKTLMNASLFRRLVWCAVFPVVLLAGCDRISSDLAHRGLPNPTPTDWYKSQYKAHRMCSNSTWKGVIVDGEKRSCVAMSGLTVNVTSSSPDLKATVYGMCGYGKQQFAVTCEVSQNRTIVKSIRHGYYISAYEVCREAFFSARRHEFRQLSKAVVLDFGVLDKDLDKNSRYVIDFAVRWLVYGSEKSKAPDKRLPFLEQSRERNRVTCEVENNKIVKITYRELGDLSWNEMGKLTYHKFF
ncbi:MAG: hypothetical protein JKX94_03615 [Sneathiella sp.]|nr:hypothetical protein [Sneathiella sp.]